MAEERGNALKNLQALLGPTRVPGRTAEDKRRVLYYPDAFKRHYMDVLGRYRIALAERNGKPVGWQAMRDLVMSPEDQRLAKERGRRDGTDIQKDRPRSGLVSLEDFKGWYHREKSHLPSDIKFQYIERFVRKLRITGEIDAIECALDEAQLEYIREALHVFYRPVPYAGEGGILRAVNMPLIESLVSYGCFELDAEFLEMPDGQKGVCLLLLRDYLSHITPVEIVLIRSNSEGHPAVYVPIFSGFLLCETVLGLGLGMMDDVVLVGKLVLIRDTGATPADDGVRVLCEGTTLEVFATFREDELQLGIGSGDGLNLIKPIFGLAAGDAETDKAPLSLRRVDRKKYLPNGESGSFFRYRPWA